MSTERIASKRVEIPRPAGIEKQPDANLQFRVAPDKMPWIYAALMNQPQVELLRERFPEPFTDIIYAASNTSGQLILAVNLGLSEEFTEKYGHTIGSPEGLEPMLRRYPKYEFSPDHSRLIIYEKDGQPNAVIARISEDRMIIQRGGGAGQLSIATDTPVNKLSVHLDQFNLLVQRFVNSIWRASEETDHKQLQLLLDIPRLPEGASTTYFSTFEIMGGRYREFPRPVRLDDIGGYRRFKDIIKSVFMDLTNPDVSRSFGTQPLSNKFILASGEEGSGKSLFPKALDLMLRERYGSDGFEHFRLPLVDILRQYGSSSSDAVKTILNHIEENEKKGVPTLLHIDNLEQLIGPNRKGRANTMLVTQQGVMIPDIQVASDAEFVYSLQATNPVITLLREFGKNVGQDSHFIIVFGESRVDREELPEGITRIFRRATKLVPTEKDLADIMLVQIRYTKELAAKTGNDPFISGIETRTLQIVGGLLGLNGRDIQQAILDITAFNKARWDGSSYRQITDQDLAEELRRRMTEKSQERILKGPLGFPLPK